MKDTLDPKPTTPKYVSAMIEQVVFQINDMAEDQKVAVLNDIREQLHKCSPFSSEPVDFVRWVKSDVVAGNDYNPNSVAPPEMELLRTSIRADGYTQPIVGNLEEDGFVVVDGFHRHRVGRECDDIKERVKGYLPIVQIRAEQVGREERMASTVRHNRARGKHKVEAMSDMVIELKRRNWSDAKISKELGMDQDEVLRLCQISGLIEIFADQAFSEAWEAEGHVTPDDLQDLRGDVEAYEDEEVEVRAANTSDENRIFHTYDKWECAAAGFYDTKPPAGLTADNCRAMYRDFLSDLDAFRDGLEKVTTEWKYSCEHYLTNSAMNRIAWLGQASMCAVHGVPSEYRGGYSLLTKDQQTAADELALEYLNRWLERHNMEPIPMEEANPDRQSDIY